MRHRVVPALLGTALLLTPTLPVAVAQQQPYNPAGQQPAAQQPTAANTQQQQIPIVPVQNAVQSGDARVVQAPWPPLPAQYQAYVEQVLKTWEARTADIKRYSCDLERWQFNPAVHETAHFSHGIGTLKFQEPGKAEFQIKKIEQLFTKEPLEYRVNEKEPFGEHWICDGRWVHILDQNNKEATRIELPPQFRDKEVYRSPLPFVFGVKADEMQARYWIRPKEVPNRPDEVWLEVVPKRADDAANYSRVQVVLDVKDILPKGLIVFMPGWTEKNQHREVYQFSNREVNVFRDAVMERVFKQAFIPSTLGSDWKVSEEPWIPPEAQNGETPGRVASPQMSQPIQR